MPNITTYENKVAAPRADDMGAQAFETEGRHVEASYAQAGNAIGGGIKAVGAPIVNHEEIQDTAAISKAGAEAFAALSKNLDGTLANADPDHIDKAADDWRNNNLENALSTIGADATTEKGQAMADRVKNTIRDEFTRQSIGQQSAIAGTQIKSNLEQTANGLAQAVSNNPSLLPGAVSLLKGSLNDAIAAHTNLPGTTAATLRDQTIMPAIKNLGVAAFKTMAERNPDAAKAAMERGDFAGMFNGEEISSLNNYADAQSRAQTTAQRAAIQQQKERDEQDFKAAASQVTGQFIQPDGSLKIPPDAPQQIIKMSLMPGAQPGEIRSLADMTKAVLKDQEKGQKAVTDPATYEMFGHKLTAGQLTDRDVYDARTAGLLSDHDTSYFIGANAKLNADPARKEAEKQFGAFISTMKPAFTKAGILGGKDPQGDQNFFQWSQSVRPQFEAAYARGGLPEAQKVLNANDPGYLGKNAGSYIANKKGATVAPPMRFDAASVDAGYAKLPKGTQFIGPDGVLRVK